DLPVGLEGERPGHIAVAEIGGDEADAAEGGIERAGLRVGEGRGQESCEEEGVTHSLVLGGFQGRYGARGSSPKWTALQPGCRCGGRYWATTHRSARPCRSSGLLHYTPLSSCS